MAEGKDRIVGKPEQGRLADTPYGPERDETAYLIASGYLNQHRRSEAS
jgi:hypothetical protein